MSRPLTPVVLQASLPCWQRPSRCTPMLPVPVAPRGLRPLSFRAWGLQASLQPRAWVQPALGPLQPPSWSFCASNHSFSAGTLRSWGLPSSPPSLSTCG